ncbi:hypothetical protein ACFT5C_30465 [Streptomyces sp. NPDC057116]|uniref:hypothetical protein n=1 Tax=Streptomyces sp. NPDC057116 TaxID=3346023 RepID=UPI00362AAEC8
MRTAPVTGPFSDPVTGSVSGPFSDPVTGPFSGPFTGPFLDLCHADVAACPREGSFTRVLQHPGTPY